MATVTIQSTSDGQENVTGGAITATGSTIYFGQDASVPRHVMLKFPLPSVGWLVDKTLTEVALIFNPQTGVTPLPSGSLTGTMQLEKAAAPADLNPASAGSISSRTRTTAIMNWRATELGTWTPNFDVTITSDSAGTTLLSLVQALVATEGPAAGFTAGTIASLNFINIYVSGSGTQNRTFYSSEGSATLGPRLRITYSEQDRRIWNEVVRVVRRDDRKVVA